MELKIKCNHNLRRWFLCLVYTPKIMNKGFSEKFYTEGHHWNKFICLPGWVCLLFWFSDDVREYCVCLCVSLLSVCSWILFFGPSCLPLSNIMSQSSCCSLVYVCAAQQSCSNKLCFISGGKGGPTAETSPRALPVGLKLHAVLCLCLERYPNLNWSIFLCSLHQDFVSWSSLWFYLSIKTFRNASFFPTAFVHFYLSLYLSVHLWWPCANCPGICDWHVCQPMNGPEGYHSQCLEHGHDAVTALTKPCLT